MYRHPHLALMVSVLYLWTSALTAQNLKPADPSSVVKSDGPGLSTGFQVLEENGRKVFVNDIAPVKTGAAANSIPQAGTTTPLRNSVLVYWSHRERRWKAVPPPTPSAMRAARFAAAEVNRMFPAASTAENLIPPELQEPDSAASPAPLTTSAAVDSAIEQAAARHRVDPNLVRAIIKVESNFNPRARSRKGAMGLMQLMPYTARSLNVSNPFDPQQNVDAGVRHLKELMENFGGDLSMSLAAYNAGAGAVVRNNGVPPYSETRNYVKQITNLYWNQAGADARPGSAAKAPIHVFRNANGVLHISNTD